MIQPESVEKTAVSAQKIPTSPAPAEMGQAQVSERAYPGGHIATLRITGTPQQVAKIKDYIRFTGASFEEV